MSTPKPERYWSNKAPEGPWDYIVIGSGMGGMTTAAMLAKLGKRVLVLEQHYVPGGFTHEFKRKGWRWDVGVHAIGEVTSHTMTGRLLSLLTDGKLKWASLGPVYEEFYWPDGFRIDFPDNPKQFRKNLLDAFPDHENEIDEYFKRVREVAGGMRSYYLARALPAGAAPITDRVFARGAEKHFQRTTADVLSEITADERLRAVFVSQWGYHGLPPSKSSFAVQALVTKHFLWGAYYPVGGSGEIARCLLRTVAEAGGWTRIRADVERILIEKDRAVGVRLVDGTEYRASRVVSAAGVLSTVDRLLPEPYRDKHWAQDIEREKPGPAHVCLYLGFKGDIRKAGASGANKWFVHTDDVETEQWEIDHDGPKGDAPLLYCSFPSLKNPAHDAGPEQLHTGEVVTFVPWEVFSRWRNQQWQRRDEDYERLKKQLHDSMLEQYLRHVPELGPMIAHSELSTPVSTHHFVRPMAGSIYGLQPTPARYQNKWLRPRSPIKNLFFSASDVVMGGVVGAMMGGAIAAVSAEPVGAVRLMSKVMQRPAA
jgi:all-trans-retinol 13,14-reductase